jgi:hypothetical protein
VRRRKSKKSSPLLCRTFVEEIVETSIEIALWNLQQEVVEL